jgi:hypothetical protein
MRALAVSALIACAIAAPAQSVQKAKFAGTVTDPSGAVVPRADVKMYWKMPAAGHPDISVKTDANGEFSVGVPPGSYDVCAQALGFLSTCETVSVGARGISAYTTRLKVDTRPICILRVTPDDNYVPLEPVALPDSIPMGVVSKSAKFPNADSIRK